MPLESSYPHQQTATPAGITLLHGHVLDKLRSLAPESIHCVVTSPPYFGLRGYNTPPQIWGGDPACEHDWRDTSYRDSRKTDTTAGDKQRTNTGATGWRDGVRTNSTCEKCGSWFGDLGMEPTPALFVDHVTEVFREVKRVLRKDGTLWLNLGDSYAGSWGNQGRKEERGTQRPINKREMIQPVHDGRYAEKQSGTGRIPEGSGLKPKDLIGIPWRVAMALQQPYYTGVIKRESDREWLAALIDGEGCIGIRRQVSSGNRNPNWNDTFIPYLTIKMSDRAPLDRAVSITGYGSVRACPEKVKEDARKVRTVRTPYVWRLDGNKAVQVARELFPHLLIKQMQSAVVCSLDDSNKEKRRGKGNSVPSSEIGLREELYGLIKGLNQRSIDRLPGWLATPESLFEPGWWLRQDIIWHKPNPMPESVRDRCTKSHEYLFLLTKDERYWYDADSIKESSITNDPRRPYTSEGAWQMDGRPEDQRHGGTPRTAGNKTHKYVTEYEASDTQEHRTKAGLMKVADAPWFVRNKRSVWTIATQPTPDAHFATMPEDLVRPCILAGCPKGGTVLDPFAGSGTTLLVARSLGCEAIGIELNEDYIKIAQRKNAQDFISFEGAAQPA